VKPPEKTARRLLASRRGPTPGSQQPKAVVEALGERVGGERVGTRRGELEREREPVEAMTDARHCARVRLVESEAGRDRAGTLDEEAHGLVAEERLRHLGGVRIGNRERRNAEDHLPRHTQGLAAGGEDRQARSRAKECVGERRARPDHVLAVVEHEQELARGQFRRDRVDESAPRECAQIECFRNGVGDVRAFANRVELDEDGAVGIRVLAAAGELER
jgi:hypothetical protein